MVAGRWASRPRRTNASRAERAIHLHDLDIALPFRSRRRVHRGDDFLFGAVFNRPRKNNATLFF
jgi:hypothetical protein